MAQKSWIEKLEDLLDDAIEGENWNYEIKFDGGSEYGWGIQVKLNLSGEGPHGLSLGIAGWAQGGGPEACAREVYPEVKRVIEKACAHAEELTLTSQTS